jgi:copper transport protein
MNLRKMKTRKRAFWLIVAAALYFAWAVSPVSAHAELVRSIPESNATLAQSPKQVELLLSEPLETNLSTIKVYDSNGQAVDEGDASVDPSNPERMTVSLSPLPDGIYTVSWQALSQIDGHVTAGSFPFAVGTVDTSAMPEVEQTTGANMPISALIAKWLLLASAAILAGQYLSKFFIWNPYLLRPLFKGGLSSHWNSSIASSDEEAGLFKRLSAAWDVLYRIGLFGILFAFALGVSSQAGQATGHELALPWANETVQVLTSTRLGLLWLVRLVLALIGLWIMRGRSISWKGMGQFIVGLALLLTISLTSHSATELHPFLPVLGDWLHLIGMSFWFGGLAHLIVGLAILKNGEAGSRVRVASSAARRFSTMALPSVAVIGVTGIYSAFLRVGSVPALLDTLYGHSLLFKQGFVAALLGIAATNLLILSPGMKRDGLQNVLDSKYLRRFSRTVLAEVVLACLLLVNVSLMTYLPPAVTPFPPTTLNGTSKVDDLKIALFISPGLIGQNTFDVRLSPSRAAQSAKSVILTFVPVTSNLPPSEIELNETGNGTWRAEGTHLSFPDRWLVEVAVQRPDKFDASVSFDFTIAKSGSNEDSKSSAIPLISKILMIVVVLLIGLNLLPRAARTPGASHGSSTGRLR